MPALATVPHVLTTSRDGAFCTPAHTGEGVQKQAAACRTAGEKFHVESRIVTLSSGSGQSDLHEVFAVRYAHSRSKAQENYIGGDPHDILQPLAYFVWVIRGAHGSFVMDTGFDRRHGHQRGRVIVKPVAEGLTAIGVDPEQVQDVIISHLHYDHCGNHDLFPAGTLSPAGSRDGLRHRPMHVSTRTSDSVRSRRCRGDGAKVFDGRVAFTMATRRSRRDHAAPHRRPLHGLQCVRVNTRRGPCRPGC
jgi:hypothetical protein